MGNNKKKKKSKSSISSPSKKRPREEKEDETEDGVFEELQEVRELEEIVQGEEITDTSKTLKQYAKVALGTNRKIHNIYELLTDIKSNQQKQRADYLRVEKHLASLSIKLEEQEEVIIVQEQEIAELKERIVKLEGKNEAAEYDPETTLVAYRVPYDDSEDLSEKVRKMIQEGLGLDISVMRTTRTPMRQGRAGLVKIQCHSLNDKLTILRHKTNLRDLSGWMRNVYIRSSKSRMERLLESNFRTVLDDLAPESYKMTGNGRIVRVQSEVQT